MPWLSLDLHYTAIQIFHSHGSRYWKGASKQASVLTPLKLYFKPISHFVNIFTFILSVRMCLYCIVLDRTVYTNMFHGSLFCHWLPLNHFEMQHLPVYISLMSKNQKSNFQYFYSFKNKTLTFLWVLSCCQFLYKLTFRLDQFINLAYLQPVLFTDWLFTNY